MHANASTNHMQVSKLPVHLLQHGHEQAALGWIKVEAELGCTRSRMSMRLLLIQQLTDTTTDSCPVEVTAAQAPVAVACLVGLPFIRCRQGRQAPVVGPTANPSPPPLAPVDMVLEAAEPPPRLPPQPHQSPCSSPFWHQYRSTASSW